MKKLLETPKPQSNSFIIWEHLLKSAVAFIGTFAMLFFGPMMLGRSRSVNGEDSLTFKFVQYLIEHPEIQIGLSVLAVLITNFYIFIKNKKIKYIIKIEQDEKTIRIELTNLYYTKSKQTEIPKSDFEFYFKNSITQDNEKRQTIVFNNTRDNKIIGEINTKHFFWSEHSLQLRKVINELKEYRTPNKITKSRKLGLNSLTNWK